MMPSTNFCSACGAANETTQTHCFACGQLLAIENMCMPNEMLLADRFQLGTVIGTGGFSTVYRAQDRQEGQVVAIKQIHLQGLSAEEMIEATSTFHREVSVLSTLTHPQIPRLYDHFGDQDHWYLVLEYLEGQTLDAFLATREAGGKRLPLEEVLDIALQLCIVLDYLHSHQPIIVFRDLKPSNILRTSSGKLYLIDFGIARYYRPGQAQDTQRLGSPGYAAPEQYGRDQTTPQTDMYSLGALLYRLLSGQDPADNPLDLLSLRLSSQRVFIHLEQVVAHLLASNPTERPASVRVVAHTLDQIKQQVDTKRIWQPSSPQTPPLSNGSPQPVETLQSADPTSTLSVLSPSPRRRLTRRGILIGLGGIAALGTGGDVWWNLSRSRGASPFSSSMLSIPSVPSNATSVPILVYSGHTTQVNAVAWSPDGTRIASGSGDPWNASEDHTVQIWDAATGRNRVTYRGHSAQVNAVVWSPDGQLIASASNDGTVQIWFAATGVNSWTYRGHADAVNALAWSPDGTRIASGSGKSENASGDTTLQVWSATGTRGTSWIYRGNVQAVNVIVWSPDGSRIAAAPDGKRITSAANDHTVQVWDAATGASFLTYRGHASNVFGLAWSPDSQRIASAADDHTVQVWDAATGASFLTYRGHANTALAVAWSPDGQRIVSAGNDVADQMQVWNATNGKELLAYQYPPTNGIIWGVEAIAWSPDGKRIATASNNATVQVWNAP